MNLCNGCGAEIPAPRYGPVSTLCADCIAHYHDNAPVDDLDVPPMPDHVRARLQAKVREVWGPAHDARAELRSQIAEYQCKRPDQIAFSARVLTVIAFIAAAAFLGTCIAAIITVWQRNL